MAQLNKLYTCFSFKISTYNKNISKESTYVNFLYYIHLCMHQNTKLTQDRFYFFFLYVKTYKIKRLIDLAGDQSPSINKSLVSTCMATVQYNKGKLKR